jgi:hypothetical protein
MRCGVVTGCGGKLWRKFATSQGMEIIVTLELTTRRSTTLATITDVFNGRTTTYHSVPVPSGGIQNVQVQ